MGKMGLSTCRVKRKSLRKDGRGISPAISTVIMTATIVVLVLVAMGYGQSYLSSSIAQNEFSTNQQFMETTGLQVDNVAWMVGRAQTIQYSSTYGSLQLLPGALTYTIKIFQSSGWTQLCTLTTGALMYNVPTTEYSLGNHFEKDLSSSDTSFLQVGPAAPDTFVYSIEQLPMSDGNFARIVIIPTVRMMTNSVGAANYVELYLPILESGPSPGYSQSVTLICQNVDQNMPTGAFTQVQVSVTFPLSGQGFGSTFFPFPALTETQTFSASTIELYAGDVSVSVGLYA